MFEANPLLLRQFTGVAEFLNGLKPDRAWYNHRHRGATKTGRSFFKCLFSDLMKWAGKQILLDLSEGLSPAMPRTERRCSAGADSGNVGICIFDLMGKRFIESGPSGFVVSYVFKDLPLSVRHHSQRPPNSLDRD